MPLPPLIPAPAELYPGGTGAFTFSAGVQIVLGQRAGDETLFAARQVQAAAREATGLLLPLRKAVEPRAAGPRIELLLIGRDQPAEGRLQPREGRADPEGLNQPAEGPALPRQENPLSAADGSQAYELDV